MPRLGRRFRVAGNLEEGTKNLRNLSQPVFFDVFWPPKTSSKRFSLSKLLGFCPAKPKAPEVLSIASPRPAAVVSAVTAPQPKSTETLEVLAGGRAGIVVLAHDRTDTLSRRLQFHNILKFVFLNP